jgi:glutaredoxin-related protein
MNKQKYLKKQKIFIPFIESLISNQGANDEDQEKLGYSKEGTDVCYIIIKYQQLIQASIDEVVLEQSFINLKEFIQRIKVRKGFTQTTSEVYESTEAD